jgi:3-dehydroquinate synthase
MNKIHLNIGTRSYDIVICYKNIDRIGAIIKRLGVGRDAVIITNSSIKHLFGNKIIHALVTNGFCVKTEIVPDTERAKSQKICIKLLNNISKFDGINRCLFIIALGGGVVGDLAGFIASIYKRGIPYIQVPTTLLAQVDSAIGGKVAIDLDVGKNLAGSFYQPRLVFSDIYLLSSLTKNDLISGLAEIMKYGIIKSPRLFKFLERNYAKILDCDKASLQYIVSECSSIKAKIVEKDEMDNKNIRIILNLGHTIGHAIETASHYSKAYAHGQAVGLGIIAASHISEQLGLLDRRTCLRIEDLIKKIGLPTKLKGLKIEDIILAQRHDKKFIHGKNRFVLPVCIGKVIVKENIPVSVIKKSIKCLL